MPEKRILVTGATGQIGSELVPALREKYGAEMVVATGLTTPGHDLAEGGPFARLEVRDGAALEQIVRQYRIGTIYHLAALLSAVAESEPQLAWSVNMNGLLNVLEVARQHGCAVFFPSSIGAFGPTAPAVNTPQETIQRPLTIYGITKVAGELLADYYFHKYGVDCRGVRFPGLISAKTKPGGGTTDYAVEIFYAALQQKSYTCFLRPGTTLELMYMPDAIRAALEVMTAAPGRLIHRNAFNLTAMSLAPEDLALAIRKIIPEFTIRYEVDPLRQAIADSWPRCLDDSAARQEWGWQPRYDLASMTREMLTLLAAKLGKTEASG